MKKTLLLLLISATASALPAGVESGGYLYLPRIKFTDNTQAMLNVLAGMSLSLSGQAADGASAVGAVIDNGVTLANASAKLLSIRNNTVEKLYFGLNGSLVITGVAGSGNAVIVPTTARYCMNAGCTVYMSETSGTVVMTSTGMDFTSNSIRPLTTLRSQDSTNPLLLLGPKTDSGTAVAIRISATANYTTAGAKILSIGDNTDSAYAEKVYFSLEGTPGYLYTTSVAAPGAATINKTCGKSAVAAGAASVVITNSEARTAADIVMITPNASSVTDCNGWFVTPGTGAFTLTCPAGVTVAAWAFSWCVNQTQ